MQALGTQYIAFHKLLWDCVLVSACFGRRFQVQYRAASPLLTFCHRPLRSLVIRRQRADLEDAPAEAPGI